MIEKDFFADAVNELYPDYPFTWTGVIRTQNDFDAFFRWVDEEPEGASFDDIMAKKQELEDEYQTTEYSRLRADAYPSLKEFAEAYTEKEILGNSEKWDEYVVKYNQVRDDYTNPEEIPTP